MLKHCRPVVTIIVSSIFSAGVKRFQWNVFSETFSVKRFQVNAFFVTVESDIFWWQKVSCSLWQSAAAISPSVASITSSRQSSTVGGSVTTAAPVSAVGGSIVSAPASNRQRPAASTPPLPKWTLWYHGTINQEAFACSPAVLCEALHKWLH